MPRLRLYPNSESTSEPKCPDFNCLTPKWLQQLGDWRESGLLACDFSTFFCLPSSLPSFLSSFLKRNWFYPSNSSLSPPLPFPKHSLPNLMSFWISPCCWDVEWFCQLGFVQVATVAVSSWARWPCHTQKTELHDSPSPSPLVFISNISLFSTTSSSASVRRNYALALTLSSLLRGKPQGNEHWHS